MIRVGIVDDHLLVAEGLARALEDEPGIELVGTAVTLDAARALLVAREPDVLIVDVRLADGTGFELLSWAGHGVPTSRPCRFLMLSSFDMAQYVHAALELGASGYVLKTAPIGQVVAAIHRVAAGDRAFEPRLIRLADSDERMQLTPRERDIVACLMRGRSNDEIAAELEIARKTVEGHLSRLFQRAGVTTRTDLALRAEREGWLLSLGGGAA